MYRTVVTICIASLTFSNSTFCPHSAFMCFVWISEQTAIISLYNINWLVFITERQYVYCAVRTVYLFVTQVTTVSHFIPKTTLHWNFLFHPSQNLLKSSTYPNLPNAITFQSHCSPHQIQPKFSPCCLEQIPIPVNLSSYLLEVAPCFQAAFSRRTSGYSL